MRAPSARRARSRPTSSKKVEDEEIRKIIRKQEEVGLQLATDGEFRRSWWHFDFFWHLDGLRARGARPRHPVPRHPDQAREPEGHGQARLPRRPPHARAFQVPEGQHQGHAEDDHPLAVGDALPRRAQGHQQAGLSRAWTPTSTTSPSSTARPSRRSTTPAAATCSSTTRCGPICAPRSSWSRRAPAARTPTSSPASTPGSSTRR